ncbi:unnamed protein product [Blepharisma stoltei]|uniref:AMP-dependent synthetase/ligase domain-containing protein n=1 Tax=Blepharisma stoltei TaxID=1481888 RepID=A0AAU9I8Y1_9CILI|nr:unnamed protein product [Blepharisma stoltei]
MGGRNGTLVHEYCSPIPGTESEFDSPIYRHPEFIDGLVPSEVKGQKTLYDCFLQSVADYPNRPFLGSRKSDRRHEYQWITYRQAHERIEKIASGLDLLNLFPDENGTKILGILSKNREEWILLEIACMSKRIASFGFFDMQRGEFIANMIKQVGLKYMCCSSSNFSRLISLKEEGQIPTLELIIQFEDLNNEERKHAANADIRTISFRELECLSLEERKQGNSAKSTISVENVPERFEVKLSPDDIFTLCSTSGTTGYPKAAIISHKNIVSSIASARACGLGFDRISDTHISYISMAHLMERWLLYLVAFNGGKVGFASGDSTEFAEDLQILKPTVLLTVPRMMHRLYILINQEFSKQRNLKGFLLRSALKRKFENYDKNGSIKHAIWDKLVLKAARRILGGKIRVLCTGSAPMNSKILKELRIILSCSILEGYGLVEGSIACLCSMPGDNSLGHVGGPSPGLEMKLSKENLPEDFKFEEYKGKIGELCLRGDSVFVGYYSVGHSKEQVNIIDKYGWLHTGDIAAILPDRNAVAIIDRKINILKLANGEFIAIERLETIYHSSSFVKQIYLHAEPTGMSIVGIVVPDEMYIKESWAHENRGFENRSYEEICSSEELKTAILLDLAEIASQKSLLPYEQVSTIYIEKTPWTPENFLTDTLKMQRFKIKQHYQNVINEMLPEGIYKSPNLEIIMSK